MREPPPLPEGPPLHLEVPGNATRHLTPFVAPGRIARMRELLARRTRRVTALFEHVHDPHNVAACVRSADACGLFELHFVTPKGRPLHLSSDVSSGANRWVHRHFHASTEDALATLRGRGYRIAATDLGGEEPPVDLREVPIGDAHPPICVALGNEHEGISEALREAADLRVRIPMWGFVESLNISVAFALTAFDLRSRLERARGSDRGDLDPETAARTLDQWVVGDVRGARRVLAELARRALPGDLSSA